MTIYKYQFEIKDRVSIEMPKEAQILSVQIQHDIPCLWALINPKNQVHKYNYRIFGTGNPFDLVGAKHISTFQQGIFVWHMFQEVGN